MTRKQMAWIVGVNAVVSTLITLLLVLVILPALDVRTTVVPEATLPTPVVERMTEPAADSTPTPELVIHEVEAGDTISGLALKYDVPEEDIIAANDLQNPNYLQVGMRLIIPIGGLPEATATFTPQPTATETPIPFEPPSADMTATAAAEAGATATGLPTPLPSTGERQVEIVEIVEAGVTESEGVVVSNVGAQRVDMLGWTLNDGDGNVYTFPNVWLWPGGNITVHTRIGTDSTTEFFWSKLVPIWSAGEVATLKDAEGNVVATLTVQP
jgi:LysM repeat protein